MDDEELKEKYGAERVEALRRREAELRRARGAKMTGFDAWRIFARSGPMTMHEVHLLCSWLNQDGPDAEEL